MNPTREDIAHILASPVWRVFERAVEERVKSELEGLLADQTQEGSMTRRGKVYMARWFLERDHVKQAMFDILKKDE